MPKEKPNLRIEAMRINLQDFLSAREFLAALFKRMKQLDRKYSWRIFSEELGMGESNALRLMVQGQRKLTAKAGDKISAALNLERQDRKFWKTLIEYNTATKASKREELIAQLFELKTQSSSSQDPQMRYFADWYNPIIRELVAMPDFNGDPAWIQERLSFPLRMESIKSALNLLESLGIVRKDSQSGRYIKLQKDIATDAEIDSMAIVRYHQKMIEMGRESITRVKEDRRDIRAATASIPAAALPHLKAKLQQWLEEFVEHESTEADQVFQLNIQLFPFTRETKK